jgi:hypothetical protein
MAIAVKDISVVAAKWAQRAGAASADYGTGVKAPRNSWATMTSAASDSWSQGTAQAAANGRFAKGVQAAGDAKWQAGAVNKGIARYPQGVSLGQPNFQNNFSRYLQAIASVNLPARQPKGSPNNYQRVQAIGDALHRLKVGG